jgi:hypothetical protein
VLDKTEQPTRRRAFAVLAVSIPAIAADSLANAAPMPSREFIRCKELYSAWFGLVLADWPNDETAYDAYDKRVESALEEYSSSLDELIALPPTRQKLSELLSLAVLESKGDQLDGEERDFLSAERALAGAMQTFEAIGEVIHV